MAPRERPCNRRTHVPRPTRRYTFLLSAKRLRGDGGAELWWSGDDAPERTALLTSIVPCCPYSSNCFCDNDEWSDAQESESARRQLVAGQNYYLELLCSGGYQTAAECSVGVRVHSGSLPRYDADAFAPQHPAARHAVQSLEFRQAGAHRDAHRLSVSAAEVGSGAQIVLSMPGVGRGASLPFAASANASEVQAALAPLLEWPCQGDTLEAGVEVHDHDTFEVPADAWRSLQSAGWGSRFGGFDPAIVGSDHGEPHCGSSRDSTPACASHLHPAISSNLGPSLCTGRHSLYMGSAYAYNNGEDYAAAALPYMCTSESLQPTSLQPLCCLPPPARAGVGSAALPPRRRQVRRLEAALARHARLPPARDVVQGRRGRR